MTTDLDELEPTAPPSAASAASPGTHPARRGRRPGWLRRRPRRPLRRLAIVTHRWISLILGIVLLAITTSGAILLYRPELVRALNQPAYPASQGPATITLDAARDIVLAAHPDFEAAAVIAEHGILRVTDNTTSWTVDPATGAVLGHVEEAPTWIGFLDNLHECLLSCEDDPGYVSALGA